MKRIPLRMLTADPPEQPLFSLEVIRQIVRKPLDPNKGADIEEMRRGIHVLDAVDRSRDQVLELEDADWEHLVLKTRSMQWAVIDRRLLTIIDDILEATEQLTLNAELALASTDSRN
jgi:hypothetical protein